MPVPVSDCGPALCLLLAIHRYCSGLFCDDGSPVTNLMVLSSARYAVRSALFLSLEPLESGAAVQVFFPQYDFHSVQR